MPGVLLVGAGPGIGRSVALRCAREKMPVSLVARRLDPLEPIVAEIRRGGGKASIHQADAAVSDDLVAAVRRATADHGVPELVVYNVGVIQADAPGDLTPEQQLDAWRVNVLGALTLANAAIPTMAERGSGTFLVTGGMPVPNPSYLSLSLGKSGVRTLVAMLAEHYAPQGIHVATVTVGGEVERGTAFDPDAIAEDYWRLHVQPPGSWQTVHLFDGERAT
jgi:NAD(P)-dependent dehydrogenase (short-subunit alcohol dehydrogenase family)